MVKGLTNLKLIYY